MIHRPVNDVDLMDVVAILTSDHHWSRNPPIFRSQEPCCLAVQKRVMDQLTKLRGRCELNPPILVAGDLLDTWKGNAEWINWLLANIPEMWTTPGQHDLAYHDIGLIHKSAYWTLHQAGRIHHLSEPTQIGEVRVHPFPWGAVPKKCPKEGLKTFQLEVALVHAYCWKEGHVRGGEVAQDQHVSYHRGSVKGYDVAVMGDNHSGFLSKREPTIIAPGTLMRRHLNEAGYDPFVGLLHLDGKITKWWLNTSEDVVLDAEALVKTKAWEKDEFLEELASLDDEALDYVAAVKMELAKLKLGRRTARMVVEALEAATGMGDGLLTFERVPVAQRTEQRFPKRVYS